MQISDLKQLDKVNGTKASKPAEGTVDSAELAETGENIDNLFGLFEDDGDYSEVVGGLLDNDPVKLQQQGDVSGEGIETLEGIYEAAGMVDDPEMQQFFSEQITDAFGSLQAKGGEYLKEGGDGKKEGEESADAVEASIL